MNPLQLLEDPLRALLDFLHDNVSLTYGWSIVVLTVIVRTALLPLVIKQYKSMRRMQAVAPQLKELQQKYKGNRQKLQEETMRFYKENEINPFSSCLPLVAQLPIFIALYYVLRDFANDATITGGSVSFMWIIPDVRLQLTDIGWGAGVLVAIYGLSQLLSTELSATPNMPDSQRRIMRVLPIVVVIFIFQFPVPSGLVLYWMTTNLWTCGQQLVMRHRIGLHLAEPGAAPQKRGSRTPPKGEPAPAAALVEGDGDQRPAGRRRRGGRAAVQEQEAPEAAAAGAAAAPEPMEAPEPTEAPEPRDAGEGPEAAAAGATRQRPGGRRQPRPKGSGRPRGSGRRPQKKKRAP